jgi:protein O-mannosyl-transferase
MTLTSGESGRGRWIAPLLVIFVAALAYSDSLDGPFILDDSLAILKNPQVRSLIPFKLPQPGPTAISGRPVVIFTFAVDYALAREKVELYHATNLAIHLLAALCLYGVVRRTLPLTWPRTWVAGAAAAVWAAHPLNTQAVTYIVQRSESLAGLFILAAIYCVNRAGGGGRGKRWWAIGAVAACALGMGSKEIAAATPILALLYDRTFLAGSFAAALKQRWKMYAGMAATWGLIFVSLRTGGRGAMVGFHLGISPLHYFRTELNVMAMYLRLTFWPDNLVLDYYDWPIARIWSEVSWQGWVVLGIAVGSLAAVWIKPWLGFLGAWFFLILAPTSSFLPIRNEAAAEQRMYLPLAAVVTLVVVCGWILLGRWRWTRWGAAIATCVLAGWLARLTMVRNGQYSTAIGIWRDTVAKRPGNTRAHINLGDAWAQLSIQFPRGSPQAMEAARRAAGQFQIVMDQEPQDTHAIFALGESLDRLDEARAAEDLYTRSLATHPEIAADLYVERGTLRAGRRDWADARADFVAAAAADPRSPEPHYFLAMLDEQVGDWKGARAELETTLKLSPNYRDAERRLMELEKR